MLITPAPLIAPLQQLGPPRWLETTTFGASPLFPPLRALVRGTVRRGRFVLRNMIRLHLKFARTARLRIHL